MALTVLITGAAGNIGEKLATHLRMRGGYHLTLLDIDPRGDPAIIAVDLADPGPWAAHMKGVDVVVHLAAAPSTEAAWEDLARPNFDAVVNVFAAAHRAGVKKVVLASSVWAKAARRFDLKPIDTGPAEPGDSPYANSKAFAERLGETYARRGMAVIALRLGGCRPGDNPPMILEDAWEDSHWTSNRDMTDGFERAIRTPVTGFHVVNLMSLNAVRRWSLEETRRLLGYRPRSRLVRPTALRRRVWKFKSFAKRLLGPGA